MGREKDKGEKEVTKKRGGFKKQQRDYKGKLRGREKTKR